MLSGPQNVGFALYTSQKPANLYHNPGRKGFSTMDFHFITKKVEQDPYYRGPTLHLVIVGFNIYSCMTFETFSPHHRPTRPVSWKFVPKFSSLSYPYICAE